MIPCQLFFMMRLCYLHFTIKFTFSTYLGPKYKIVTDVPLTFYAALLLATMKVHSNSNLQVVQAWILSLSPVYPQMMSRQLTIISRSL